MINKSWGMAIAKKLRCASSVDSRPTSEECFNCSFCVRDDLTDVDLPIKPDIVVNGTGYAICCDGDKVMQEAAEFIDHVIDSMQNGNE